MWDHRRALSGEVESVALPRCLSRRKDPGLTASPGLPSLQTSEPYFLCNQAVSNPFQQVRMRARSRGRRVRLGPGSRDPGVGGEGGGWGIQPLWATLTPSFS